MTEQVSAKQIPSTGRLLAGLLPATLSGYLAGLGVVRVLGEQADSELLARWSEEGLVIQSRVPDIADWLVTDYRPTPIISPWNGGSGFGAKDKTPRDVLLRFVRSDSERLAEFRAAYAIAAPLAATADERGWSKERLVAELRNVCPEPLLRWLDAAIVLRDNGAAFPPLLGTGGNDGRLDFSTNFHQRLLDVIPELGAQEQASRLWAVNLLHGRGDAALVKAAIGQFDPGGAGGRNSSPFGSAESLVNPWEFVLLIEGALYFASGVVRRQGAATNRAAMPFCVYSSADGPTPGAAGEQSRGEIWAPLWQRGMRPAEITQLFAESRASWQGEVATQSAQMYAALRSYGVARGIDGFVRYGLHMRNGLAFSAVRLDEVDVRADADIDLAVEPERHIQAFKDVQSRSVAAIVRSFRRSQMAFVRDLGPTALRDMLADLTLADLAVSRSDRSRGELGWRPPLPSAAKYAEFLANKLPDRRAFRIAAALAGNWAVVRGRRASVRDLVLGVAPRNSTETWTEPVVSGFGVRPLVEVLADLVRWRSQQDEEPGCERGFVPLPSSAVRIDWSEIHDWVEQPKLDYEVNRSFLACLALNWWDAQLPNAGAKPVHRPPIPELALLQAFGSGRLGTGAWKSAVEARASGVPWESAVAGAGVLRYGLDRSWPTRLLADRTRPGHESPVLSEVARRLAQLGWKVAAPRRTDIPAHRLIAALVSRSSLAPLRRLGALPPGATDDQPTAQYDINPDKEGGS